MTNLLKRFFTFKHFSNVKLEANKSEADILTELDLTFKNYKSAYKNKTTWEICRGFIVYQLLSIPPISDNNATIMKNLKKYVGLNLFNKIMKLTFYGHFVSGEDENTAAVTMKKLMTFGVHSIVDYSVEEDLNSIQAEERERLSTISTYTHSVSDANLEPLRQFQWNSEIFDRRYHLQCARTFFYLNEATCEKNMEIFLKSLEVVSPYDNGVASIKMTALGRPQLLMLISEVIERIRRFSKRITGSEGSVISQKITRDDMIHQMQVQGFSLDFAREALKNITEDSVGLIHLFPWDGIINSDAQLSRTFVVPDFKTKAMVPLISQLTEEEESMFRNMVRRVTNIVQAADQLGVSVMIDAEQTYFQPAISRITMELMRKFNLKRAIVKNTYQCYLKKCISELAADLEQAKRQDFYFGAKLVRGAYLEQERLRASTLKYPDPTNPTYEATTTTYHSALNLCLKKAKEARNIKSDSKKVEFMVASHNENTVRFAIEQMKDYCINPEDGIVTFGQLYGMCDYITFPLGESGYAAYKYLPYGPVAEVLPYLSRRAQENKGILDKAKKEKSMLRKELLRRILTLHFFRKPKGPFPIHYNS